MRTLNRPMFRYGGPIKEGVMDGIREPKKNGGAMGTRQAALVGDPVYPQTAGREHHKVNVVKNVLGVGTKGAAAKPGFITSQLSKLKDTKIFDKLKNFYNKNTTKIPKYTTADGGIMYTQTPMAQRALQFAKANPKQTAAGVGVGASSGLLENVVGGGLDLAGRGIMQAGDLLVSDKYFDQDKYMKENFPDGLFGGKKKTVEADELTADQLEIKRLNDLLGKKDDVPIVPKKTEKEIRDEQMSKYEKIMDIKGMKKDAAYNSLIAASQLINSEGDFKGSLKDGSLISKLIASTSKAYDKPANTRDALKSLLAKAEIEKDINLTKGNASTQSITALANASGRSEKYIANAKLQIPNSPGEAVAQLAKLNSGALTSDKVTAVISNYASENGIPFKQQITTEEKLEKVGKGKDYATVVEFVNDLTLDPGGANDGLYVVGTSVVQVTDGVAKLKG